MHRIISDHFHLMQYGSSARYTNTNWKFVSAHTCMIVPRYWCSMGPGMNTEISKSCMQSGWFHISTGFCPGHVLAYITPCIYCLGTVLLPKRMLVCTGTGSRNLPCYFYILPNSDVRQNKTENPWLGEWCICQWQPTCNMWKFPRYFNILYC